VILTQILDATQGREHALGVGAALASAASWAVGTILFKGIGENFSPFAMTLVKSLFSVLLLAIGLLFIGWTSVPVSSLGWLILSGLIGIAAGDTCFFAALRLLPVHQLIILMMLAPGITLVMAILLLGETPSPIAWMGIAMVLSGVTLTLAPDLRKRQTAKTAPTGLLFGLLSILCMAVSVIIAKIGLHTMPAFQATFLRMAAGFCGMLVVALARKQIKCWLEPLRRGNLKWRFAAAAAIVTFGGFWLALFSVKRLDVSVANTLLATEPIFGLPLSVIWLRERPTALAWSGAVVALPGALLLALNA
jgi:drug/metabolite transporter (DMT)-like permease